MEWPVTAADPNVMPQALRSTRLDDFRMRCARLPSVAMEQTPVARTMLRGPTMARARDPEQR
jgi:hypothetical protein